MNEDTDDDEMVLTPEELGEVPMATRNTGLDDADDSDD